MYDKKCLFNIYQAATQCQKPLPSWRSYKQYKYPNKNTGKGHKIYRKVNKYI